MLTSWIQLYSTHLSSELFCSWLGTNTADMLSEDDKNTHTHENETEGKRRLQKINEQAHNGSG